MTSHPSKTPDEPMTREQLRMVVDDDVAVRALLLLGQPMPTWNEWLRLNNQVAKFMSGKY